MKNINIAIDGPAGAGKSTIAKMVSKKLGYIYVDTGALYRTIALYITENNISDEDIENALPKANVSLKFIDGAQRVFLGVRDVSDIFRTPDISMAASRTSALPAVTGTPLLRTPEKARLIRSNRRQAFRCIISGSITIG